MIVRRVFLGILLASAGMPALAQQPGSSTLHGGLSSEIIVTAPFARDRFSLTTAVSVLEGEALVRETRPTIGEMLSRQPGVSASFFGPNSSRPILRGQDAERVRVLTDGIGSFDVSNTSVDHAVAINPFLVDRVEVVRGPAALLYGSNAIGGVVNVRDRRIPREVPDEPIHIDLAGFYASAAEERGGAGSVDVPVLRAADGSALVLHVDGSYLKTGDYRTGGFVFSEALREEAAEIGGEVVEDALARGRVDNTSARTWTIGGGMSWLGPNGAELGFAVSHMRSNYGVPNGLELDDDDHDGEHEEDHEEEGHEGHGHEDIRLDMRQTRVDARALVPMDGTGFEALKFRFGYADYQHDEIEGDEGIAATFLNQSFEGRLELVQRERGGWKGATGAQIVSRRFESVGEVYIPRNLTTQVALFTLQEFDLGGPRVDIGARWENSSVESDVLQIGRHFNSFSGSLGVSLPLGEAFSLGVSATHSERAPSAEELFANGAHIATRTFEVGDADFEKELSNGLEAVLRGRGSGWRLEASAFFTRFRNFIYLSPTGGMDEGLPVFNYQQDGARFWGAELDAGVTVARSDATRIELTGLVDFSRADILGGGGRVPRIPPLRMLGGVQAIGGAVGGRIEVEHVTRQTRIAGFESETPGWTMVNASINWRPLGVDSGTIIMLSANNLFDVEARRHSSFLKNEAPLAGRDIRVTARLSF